MRKCKQVNVARCGKHQAAQVCEERAGPTPSQGPEGTQPGRATAQRQGYWGDDSLGDEVHAPGQLWYSPLGDTARWSSASLQPIRMKEVMPVSDMCSGIAAATSR